MSDLDFNLLVALDALLREQSVSAAARRLGLSTSAMSRTLSRLRTALGDPILVPAGRGMVATPHALAIAEDVHVLKDAVKTVLSPPSTVEIREVRRDFTIRANEAFVLLYAADLSAAVTKAAPGIRLRFAPRADKDVQALRDAAIDLDIGVLPRDSGELRCQTLFEDRFVGVARAGHPIFDADRITVEHYTAWGHVLFSTQADFAGPIDRALAELGHDRDVRLIVPSFPAVIAVAAASDLIGTIPKSYCKSAATREIRTFDLPIAVPGFNIVQAWHPRMDTDLAHRWLRALMFETFHAMS
ncbi:DNA-binding transcriptional LysR family regulator [Rhizobium leguminosarum]|uniref:DNA-binding transcriptional LysR family regulator n=1 Tax=Rhizobium leguminosarum TaxID=384 RepID=A0AAE2MGB9_RHILE|nr:MULTISPECIES: LysR family transcriptional regulator [Rhizobium]MBB4288781.1 DNA-binding transcriptional LysR family regulator [Rhizobium leguminosarum]MBB4295126.1 DNA-binding transcriptional LysR family regulator [Rhizobium leguminosarum]MBB4306519.1 DNA-binding transcriptional LysR family regulator [Rhizobium leguminosarum]MBB4417899.1 DNA-binding transcriptional LysR family regulator [Rhizobium leguminosarum]MBB4432745.1 DNA-binding transcriptional LysR family regulator [Rhizobium espera